MQKYIFLVSWHSPNSVFFDMYIDCPEFSFDNKYKCPRVSKLTESVFSILIYVSIQPG